MLSRFRLLSSLLIIAFLLPFVNHSNQTTIVDAYPGSKDDESCDALIEQSRLALQSGQDVEPPDCVQEPGMSAMEMRAAYATMDRYPTAEVSQVPIQNDILKQRTYRRIVGNVEFYDAPGGNIMGTIEQGYNFVAVRAIIEGWVQLSNGQWVSSEHVQDADVSELAGVELTSDVVQPFAWMIQPARPSDFPGGSENPDATRLQQYQILNIYGIEVVDGWEWYMVGPNMWLQQTRVAKFKPVQRPDGVGVDELWIAVDLYEQTAIAYEGDYPVFATLISSGLPQWSTNQGLFQIYIRATATPMSGATGQPDFYFIENVPWVMYFDNDIALHGTYWHDRFGYRQSHGCVNLSIMDSWWIYQWSASAPNGAAWVYVYSSGEYRPDLPAWARRSR